MNGMVGPLSEYINHSNPKTKWERLSGTPCNIWGHLNLWGCFHFYIVFIISSPLVVCRHSPHIRYFKSMSLGWFLFWQRENIEISLVWNFDKEWSLTKDLFLKWSYPVNCRIVLYTFIFLSKATEGMPEKKTWLITMTSQPNYFFELVVKLELKLNTKIGLHTDPPTPAQTFFKGSGPCKSLRFDT